MSARTVVAAESAPYEPPAAARASARHAPQARAVQGA